MKIFVGENDPEDLKETVMDPNTRTLIRLEMSDMENDMEIFRVLRGSTPTDAQNRKLMMKMAKIDKELIDT